MMKRILIYLLLSLVALSGRSEGYTPDDKIGMLITDLDYFELQRQYPIYKDSIHPAIGALAQAILDDALNKPQEACRSMEYMIRNHQELGFETALNMIVLWAQNLIKLGKYTEAYEMINPMLESPKINGRLHPETEISLRAVNAKAEALRGLPKIELVRPDEDCIIPMLQDSAHRMHIDATINGQTASFIFDTGGDGPAFISKEFAAKHGFKIMGDSVPVSGLLQMNYTKIGYVDSIQIGNMVFRNFWAVVNPDAEIRFQDRVVARIDAVLGRYVMDMVGEFHLLPSQQEILFPVNRTPKPETGSNMLLLNGQPFVETRSQGEPLLFHFDTGGGVNLNATYYNKHKERIDSLYQKSALGVGGVGGAKQMTIYKKPRLELMIGTTPLTLYDVPILTEELKIGARGDGMLGMDVIKSFDEVIVNFREMFVKLVDH